MARLFIGVAWTLGGLLLLACLLAVVGWGRERMAERRDARRYPPPGAMVDIGGRRLRIECSGAGAPTVVVEAGGGNFGAMLSPLQARIGAFTRVCTYDRAGLGWSDPGPAGRSLDARADDLGLLLERAGVPGPYVLVGHSLGGLLVRAYARKHPNRVAGLVLVDAAEEDVVFQNLPTLSRAAEANRSNVLLARLGVLRLAMGPRIAAAKAQGRMPAETVDAIASRMVRAGFWRAVLDEISAYSATESAERRAGGFGGLGDKPLVVIGHGKPFAGAMAPLEAGWSAGQERLAALSSNSRLIVAEGTGHDIPSERPNLVADAVREVVDAVRAKAQPEP